jgi:HlyD family secretion protein
VRIVIVLLLLIVAGYFAAPHVTAWISSAASSEAGRPTVPPVQAIVDAKATTVEEPLTNVAALGKLEPASGIIDVGAMTGDRIATMLVHEGDEVTLGQELARLESYPLRETELDGARIALADAERRKPIELTYGQALIQAAQAGVKQAELMARDRALLAAKIALAEAAAEVAKHDLKRLEGVDTKIASAQDREHQQLRVRQAEAEAAAAHAELDKLDAAITVAKAQAAAKMAEATAGTPRLEAVLQIDLLKQNVKLSEEKLKMSVVRAPTKGRVLKIFTRPGETIAQRPVLRLADTSQMVAVCEVYETHVNHVSAGQTVTITSRALARPLHGKVAYVGQMVAKNEVFGLDPVKAADKRVVEVRVDVDEDAEAARLVNLQVEVSIATAK